MKKISFVSPNFQQGPRELNAHYLPYSAGVLLSYAFSHEQVSSLWEINEIIWKREPIEEVAQRLQHDDMVAFSTYVWNHRYNYALAQRIKALNPDCVIVLGGPEPAITDPELFAKNPWMDLVVVLEGEITFRKVLEDFGSNYRHIPGLLINDHGQVINTGNSERISDLDQIPSPYLTGIFDAIMAKNPGVEWHGTIETNRGCPYSCTFCDWGSLTYNKVKKFPLDRVFDELDWIGEHCGYVTITDANFGMFVERDDLIISKLIEVQRRWMKVRNFSITWAKNQKNEVVNIVKKLIRESPFYGAGLTVSVQSMDHDVLENIKRKNLDQHKIDEVFALCARDNIPVYTELILGLPGDTAETWRESIWRILRAGNHSGINILHAALLENAEMNLLQRRLWGLESAPMFDYMSGSYSNGEIDECVDIVIGTREMPRDVMLEVMVWNSFIQAFHINGLTSYIARYLAKQGVDYSVFYEKLYRHVQNDAWFQNEFAETKRYYQEWIKHGRVNHPPIGRVEVLGWNMHNRTTWNLYYQQRIDVVYDMVREFLRSHYPAAEMDELLKFQRASIIDYARLRNLPETIAFNYDFFGFLVEDSKLDVPSEYTFSTTEDRGMTLQMFLENFWFGRKRNFGKARINKHATEQQKTSALAAVCE